MTQQTPTFDRSARQPIGRARRAIGAAVFAALTAFPALAVAGDDQATPPTPRQGTFASLGTWASEQERVLSEQVERFLKRLNVAAAPQGPATRPAGNGVLAVWQQSQRDQAPPPMSPIVSPRPIDGATLLPATPDAFAWPTLDNNLFGLPGDMWFAPAPSDPTDALAPTHVATAANRPAAVAMVDDDELVEGKLLVTVNDSRVVKTSRPFYRVSVASPEVADVTPLAPDTLLINSKASGNTQLVLWDEHEQTQTLLVQSQADLREVQEKLNGLLGHDRVEAVDLKGKIALRGRVAGAEQAQQAVEIAAAYGEVVDFLTVTGNQQVMLEIRFAEVSRSASKQLGVNFAFADGTSVGGSSIGGVNPIFPGTGDTGLAANSSGAYNVPGNQLGAAVSVFGGGEIGETAFNFFISALRENNLLRVLAEPNLTVISGEEGEFLAGGEFPIPVPNEEGIGIEYREFGIKLRYLPVVLGDGRIRLRVEPEVSDLDFTSAVSIGGTRVPGLRKRSLSTTVELTEGQTFALAGLLDSATVANKQSTPLLGDVPVLGALFRSTRYQRRETELVVLVTPRLVSPMNPDQVGPLPGENWKHPNEIELFLLGQMGGEGGVDKPHQADAGGADNAATKRDAGPKLEASYTYLPPERATAGK